VPFLCLLSSFFKERGRRGVRFFGGEGSSKVKGQREKVKVKIANRQLSKHRSEPSPLLFSRRGEGKG
jgi:hypothetical protein